MKNYNIRKNEVETSKQNLNKKNLANLYSLSRAPPKTWKLSEINSIKIPSLCHLPPYQSTLIGCWSPIVWYRLEVPPPFSWKGRGVRLIHPHPPSLNFHHLEPPIGCCLPLFQFRITEIDLLFPDIFFCAV